MRTSTWVAVGAGTVVVGLLVGAGIYEHKAHAAPANAGTKAPTGGAGLVFKPSVSGGAWAQLTGGGGGAPAHLQPLKIRPNPPIPSVTFPLSTSSPMSTSATAGTVVAIVVPARFNLTQVTALSQPAPIDASPIIPAGVDTGQGGTVLVTLTGYAGDVVFSGIDPGGNAFSALLQLVGFSKP